MSSPSEATAYTSLDDQAVAVIRGIAMDGPEAAMSGHPGTAMALAPLAHVLFSRVMNHDPSDPSWPDRDRFILSCGHASILLYSMLYLCGYGLTLDDLRSFREWGSRTPGHPEAGLTPGVEVTTGPLGQGIANAVGMALAERWLRSRFGSDIVDHRTFGICSDGDLMEGISHEAASLAGHLRLGRLVLVYDDNHITIDGPTELALDDDPVGRFEAYGWHVERAGEIANDMVAIEAALRRALEVEDRPSLVVLRSHIGWPSPHKTDTSAAHGDPLGAEEIKATKAILGLPVDQPFYSPDEVRDLYTRLMARGQEMRMAWEKRLAASRIDREAWDLAMSSRPVPGWADGLPAFEAGNQIATRRALNDCIRATASGIPGLLAGSADLTGNTGVALADHDDQSASNPGGTQVHYGIREHAMGAMMNGMALHGGVLPVGGTFFVFSDYMRPAVRLAALSGAHVVYSWTHDSIGLGQDGPTHQPVEHLAALRAMPGLRVIRPADANECAEAWRLAVELPGPTALVLSRQALPVLEETAAARRSGAAGVAAGGYVLREPSGSSPAVVLVGTGSEVQLCLEAARELDAGGIPARVVSLPSFELFAEQDPLYRQSVLPANVPTLAVEAASSFGWERYADDMLGIDHFGASAPGAEVMAHFGFSAGAVAERARRLLALGPPGAPRGQSARPGS